MIGFVYMITLKKDKGAKYVRIRKTSTLSAIERRWIEK